MIASMTGFARREASGPWGALVCELRSVNHRFLDMKVRLPWPDVGVEASIAETIRLRLQRGRVEVVVRAQGVAAVPVWISEPGRAQAHGERRALLRSRACVALLGGVGVGGRGVEERVLHRV